MSAQTKTVWRERLASPLTWHFVGFGILLIVTIVLAVRFGLDWAATSASSVDAMAQKRVHLTALDLQTAPLRGLDKKVPAAHKDIADFYTDRIPPNYSTIDKQIGKLQVDSGARLTRAQYTQTPASADLTEIKLDCGISGEYPQIMRFVNSLERDKIFFIVRQMQLTGQQGGFVNLRLQVSTWLRPADAAASGLPQSPATAPGSNSAPGNPESPSASPSGSPTGPGKAGE